MAPEGEMRRVVIYFKDFSFDGRLWGYRIKGHGIYEESFGFKTKAAAMRDYAKHYKRK